MGTEGEDRGHDRLPFASVAMKIVIPTAGRVDKMATFHALPPALQKVTTVVVQHRERMKYADKSYPDIWVLPKGITKINTTRQHIIENVEDIYGDPHVCMLDDDFLSFGWRADMESTKLVNATPAQINMMFRTCANWLKKGVVHCGITPRNKNHTSNNVFNENGRLCQMLCFDARILLGHNVKFTRIPMMTDFDVVLQLLRLGYNNKILYRGCTNSRGSTPAGGCNMYRTPEMQSKSARKLAKLHPEFVKLRPKGDVMDVTVQWKRAFKSSQEQ